MVSRVGQPVSPAVSVSISLPLNYQLTAEVTLSAQNRIVLPKDAREALDLKPGDKLLFAAHDDGVIVATKKQRTRKAARSRANRSPSAPRQ
jgi:AbrB family looped-hinge helix DNA binding protein